MASQSRFNPRPGLREPVTLTRCACGVFYVPGQPHACDVRQIRDALDVNATAAQQGDKTDARH